MTQISREVACKVLSTVDAGLVSGMGEPIPGQMCVEAAVCYAMGLPHSDRPPCVAPVLQQLKINLNDKPWSSSEARAKGLRRLAVAQLGSAGQLDEKEFIKRVAKLAITQSVPTALRAAASLLSGDKKDKLLNAADLCERDGTRKRALEAREIANAAASAAANAA